MSSSVPDKRSRLKLAYVKHVGPLLVHVYRFDHCWRLRPEWRNHG